MTEIANGLEPFHGNLPVVTQEMGDTWIYGISSDPLKVARYREISRLQQSWIMEGKFRSDDATDVGLLRHAFGTGAQWGTDTKTWLDFDNYVPADLSKMLHTKNYEVVQHTWEEKRQDLIDGIAALPENLRTQHKRRFVIWTRKSRFARGNLMMSSERNSRPNTSCSVSMRIPAQSAGCAIRLQDTNGRPRTTHWDSSPIRPYRNGTTNVSFELHH